MDEQIVEKNEDTKKNEKKWEKTKKFSYGKKYALALQKFKPEHLYLVNEAFGLLSQISYAQFDESVDVSFNLGVDPKHADQMVRGAVVLPNGIGKTVRVVVLAKGEKAKEAALAGADEVGADDLIEKIAGGWFEFDKMVASPDMMVAVSKIGKILGPRGLMPNPKLGTVTFDVAKAVKEQKLGKVEYRTEKAGIIHVAIGKKSFPVEKLRENFLALAGVIIRAKPPTSKGVYLRGVALSTTMSPAVRVQPMDVMVAAGFA